MFVRAGQLGASIAKDGQHTPILLRRHPDYPNQFQTITGFRRLAVLAKLGEHTALAIVHEQLADDDAMRLALLDNAQRSTLRPLDVANTILKLERCGLNSTEVAALMGFSRRQKNNLKSLLLLPPIARAALDDELAHFTATHALVLRQSARSTGLVNYETWLQTIRAERLSVRALKRRLSATTAVARAKSPELTTVFNEVETDFEAGVVRLLPIKIARDLLDPTALAAHIANVRKLLVWLEMTPRMSLAPADGSALAGSDET